MTKMLDVSTCVQELVDVTNQTQHYQTIHALKKAIKALDVGNFS